jgi:hypothetical protein
MNKYIAFFVRYFAFIILTQLLLTDKVKNSKPRLGVILDEYNGMRGISFTKNFTPNQHTLVFFHIQKTSGTNFDLDLIDKLEMTHTNEQTGKITRRKVCERFDWKYGIKVSYCRRPDRKQHSLYLSWHTDFGWSCGLHPGLSDLKQCVFKRKYKNADLTVTNEDFFFVSMLREPILRFVSEWGHVFKTGSAWLYELKPISEDQKCLTSENKRPFCFAFELKSI